MGGLAHGSSITEILRQEWCMFLFIKNYSDNMNPLDFGTSCALRCNENMKRVSQTPGAIIR